MNTMRQDAWTKDEDILLAETVLRYIREGKTQLEAFKRVAKKLSRTSAACGFRWNASIRKQYDNAIRLAKQERKIGMNAVAPYESVQQGEKVNDPIDTAILLLKQMQTSSSNDEIEKTFEERVNQLEEENQVLRQQIDRYFAAWNEMGKLWEWVTLKEKE